jgi:hypothetical protein
MIYKLGLVQGSSKSRDVFLVSPSDGLRLFEAQVSWTLKQILAHDHTHGNPIRPNLCMVVVITINKGLVTLPFLN